MASLTALRPDQFVLIVILMSNNKKVKKTTIEQVPDIILLNLLRTHLVFEGLLKEFIKTRLNKPKLLPKLSFYKTLCLARSLHEHKDLDNMWDALEKLNKLRNKLAHYFAPKDFDSILDDFLKFVEKNFSLPNNSNDINDRTVLATATLLNHFAPKALKDSR